MDFIKGRMPTDSDIKNRCNNGECSRCCSCCSEFLPLTLKEVRTIREYVKEHNVPELYPSTDDVIKAVCPFCDFENQRCNIYEVRPAVCSAFKCDASMDRIDKNRKFYSQNRAFFNRCGTDKDHSIYNMVSLHSLFFDDYNYDHAYRFLLMKQFGYQPTVDHMMMVLPMVVDKLVGEAFYKPIDIEALYKEKR